MDDLVMYAAGAVILTLVLIPIATVLAFLPYTAAGGVGRGLLGRGGTDDQEAEGLLHPRAEPNARGFYEDEVLNRPFERSKSA